MIKIRLEGTPGEVEQAAQALRESASLRILEESRDYRNRPPSTLVRRYFEVESIRPRMSRYRSSAR